ncbi:FAD:protein FMN transferase [Clostridium sp. NSJ-6]|uniref:FAD:protein FMN transferase n=1 Tax=Clostridium hominis TaxID=2763036 RepID=A0ABR7DH64_9CLOT|nr:FAD:protein FMN transferase [Clostridium hominis]MBC5630198.1 FAD:protein FMN transferase [Clostridium hominis]MDU2671489.1 FAD:protein FMN transferase [Clostridium sp.]
MYKLKKYAKSLLCLSLVFMLVGCSQNTKKNEETAQQEPVKRTEMLMGTVISVTLYDSTDESILDKVFDKVKNLEETFSINETGTEVDKINDNAGIEPVKVSDDTIEVVKEGIYYSDLSHGKFDITIGPLVKLWNIPDRPTEDIPTQDELNLVLPLTNYKDVVIDEANKTVFLTRPGMMLDLGGIAKGYAADVISKMLTDEGVKSAIIDLGGNIFAHGEKVSGDAWKIGIQNPFSNRGEIVGAISVKNKSIVTSGIYERYIEVDGVKYHHILNPETGYPYENDIAGITIISDKSTTGDALSTSVFALGIEEGMKFVEELDDVDAIFVTKEKGIYVTSGIKDNFELRDENFKLMN